MNTELEIVRGMKEESKWKWTIFWEIRKYNLRWKSGTNFLDDHSQSRYQNPRQLIIMEKKLCYNDIKDLIYLQGNFYSKSLNVSIDTGSEISLIATFLEIVR